MVSELGEQLIALRQQINLLELQFATLASQFAATFSDDECWEHNPVPWLRNQCHMTSHAASSALQVGDCAPHIPQSIAALRSGELGWANLSWMANTAQRLAHSDTAPSGFAETKFLDDAKELNVQQFRRKCEQFIHTVDRQLFVDTQVDDVEGRRLRLSPGEDGWVRIDGSLDPEGGAVVLAALDPLSRPKNALDYRGLAQRHADALVEACSHLLDTAAIPQQGGQRPHLHVTTTLPALLDHVGADAAELENGALLSSITVQRLACDGTMVRVLVNPPSQVIDVGRAARVVPGSTRRALSLRDRGCRWPGCDRPASWTQAHHLVHVRHEAPVISRDGGRPPPLGCRQQSSEAEGSLIRGALEKAESSPDNVESHLVLPDGAGSISKTERCNH